MTVGYPKAGEDLIRFASFAWEELCGIVSS
jgi:hypothetical protein